MGTGKVKACFAVGGIALVFFLGDRAAAVSPDFGFYKGKVVNYIVATKPGGGYDAYARTIGKYMQKHIPGSTVIIKNMPGAGHIIGANETYQAKPDGLTIGTFNTGLVYSQIVGFRGIKFDLAKYSWIGKASSETRVFVVSVNSPYKSFKDVLDSKEPLKLAASGVGTAAYNDVLIVAAATGAPLKVIPGYGGREGEMAMMRGEVVGQIGSYIGLISFIKAKECRVLLQIAAKKHKDLPDVPLAAELNFSEKAKKILAVIDSVAELGRLTAGPPNIPAARLQVLRDAYKKALADPEFLKDAAKMDLDLDPGFGDDVARLVKAGINQPQENLEILRKIIKIED
jgi:tripartite-type tricarboxylate transporter receptor subunit TctC